MHDEKLSFLKKPKKNGIYPQVTVNGKVNGHAYGAPRKFWPELSIRFLQSIQLCMLTHHQHQMKIPVFLQMKRLANYLRFKKSIHKIQVPIQTNNSNNKKQEKSEE